MARTRRGRQRKVAADVAEAELEKAVEDSGENTSSPRLRAVSRRRRRRLRPRRRSRHTDKKQRNGKNHGEAALATDPANDDVDVETDAPNHAVDAPPSSDAKMADTDSSEETHAAATAENGRSRRRRRRNRKDNEQLDDKVLSSGSWTDLSEDPPQSDEAEEAVASLAASTTLDDEEAAVLLTEVKTALDEAKTSTAHTDYTLRSIGEEVRSISQRQLNYEKKYVLNSVFAYVIFCALIFGGLYLVFDARSSKNAVDKEYYEGEIDRLTERIGVAEQELQKYREASHLAFEVYQLIEQARYEEALERYIEVQDKLINPAEAALMAGEIENLRWKLAEESYRKGMDLYGDGSFEQARDAFFESIAHQTETPYAHLRNFYLAMSLYELGDFEGSRTYFGKALEHELGGDLDATARYHYAVATEKVGESDKAYELYDKFLKHYRYHKFSDEVVRRQGRIERARIRARAAKQRAKRQRAQERKEAEQRAKKKED